MRILQLIGSGAAAIAATQSWAQTRYVIADRTTDAVHALWDANGNGVIDEPGEVSTFFSASNSAGTLGLQNPTAMGSGPDGVLAVGDQINRNLYLLEDLNQDGDALDVGESRVAADAANASGVSLAFPTGAAFDITGRLHVVNAGNAYGNDGIYRFQDLNSDGVICGTPRPGCTACTASRIWTTTAGRTMRASSRRTSTRRTSPVSPCPPVSRLTWTP